MDCPTCERPLNRTTYEQTQVHQCEECSGYLVAQNRLRLIRSSRDQDNEALKAEAGAEQREDTQARLLCPKCRADRMMKERVRVSEDETFHLDVCPKCKHVWLDGGELARLQLKFEQSAKAVEAFARQERLQNLDDGDRKALDKQINELPASEHFLHGAAVDLVLFGTAFAMFVGTLVSCLFFSQTVAAIFSLALAAVLAAGASWRFELTRNQRMIFLGAIGLIEVIFLGLLAVL